MSMVWMRLEMFMVGIVLDGGYFCCWVLLEFVCSVVVDWIWWFFVDW